MMPDGLHFSFSMSLNGKFKNAKVMVGVFMCNSKFYLK